MWKKVSLILLILTAGAYIGFFTGCNKKEKALTVYSGKGLKHAMEEIKKTFEQTHDMRITIIYAGSETLLETIKKTRRGDVFVPGSVHYIKAADELVTRDQYVALHIPVFTAMRHNQKGIRSYSDLSKPGIKIAVGNKNMAAIGRVADKIVNDSEREIEFEKNISITASTVNELLDLVLKGEADAALIWADMLQWQKSKGLIQIAIPLAINKVKEIHVAELARTSDQQSAALFADFVASEGKAIFIKHGFGEK